MDDLYSSPASANAAAAAGSLQTVTAGDLGALGGAENSSTHRENAAASSIFEYGTNVPYSIENFFSGVTLTAGSLRLPTLCSYSCIA